MDDFVHKKKKKSENTKKNLKKKCEAN